VIWRLSATFFCHFVVPQHLYSHDFFLDAIEEIYKNNKDPKVTPLALYRKIKFLKKKLVNRVGISKKQKIQAEGVQFARVLTRFIPIVVDERKYYVLRLLIYSSRDV
jgi:hypothetical protein